MHLALDRAEINYDMVYYAEIDKYANNVTEHHFPSDVALGDVTKWREWNIDWSSIGLVGAGFPCQSWSVAGQQLGDKDERGMLFWTTLEIISHVLKHNPNAKFIMENVKMKKDFEEYITHHTTQALGYVEKTLINSALVSAQNRNRYYWTNFKIDQPQDRGILLRDVLEDQLINIEIPNNAEVKKTYVQWDLNNKGNASQDQRAFYLDGKHGTLPANGGGSKCKVSNLSITGGAIRGRYNADGSTSQKLEINNTGKTNTLTTVQKDNVVVYNTADNPRIKGITEDDRGFRPHKGDKAKSGISECGRILKETANKTDTVTAAHAPKILLDNVVVFNNETATSNGKAYTLTASYGGAVAWNSAQKKQRTMVPVKQCNDNNPNTYNGLYYRKLTPTECARLQTFPDGWCESVISNSQSYKAYGNAWTVDVIAHILKQANF